MENKEKYFEVLFDYVEQLVKMPQVDKATCKIYMKPLSLKKDEYISRQDRIPRYHNFIVSGHVRKYHIDHKNEEVTTDINNGPQWFSSYQPFATQTLSHENLHCITDVELLSLSKEDMVYMANVGITQKDYTLLIFEQIINQKNERLNDLHTLSAEERYSKLVLNHPNIIKHVPLKYIASYLGIKPGSLSRIRKELMHSGACIIT